MNTSILDIAAALSDRDLLNRLAVIAGREREASVELVAHLAALETRPNAYAAKGYGSLFGYCTQALRLSEDAACNRIEVARACRRFPMALDLLATGAMSLTSVRLLAPHLTEENHAGVLAKASGRTRRQIEALVAELAPRPDAPTSVRKLPTPTALLSPPSTPGEPGRSSPPPPTTETTRPAPSESATAIVLPPALPKARPIVEATAPERYRVQFTIGEKTHEKLRRLQALLRREIPDGDPAVLFDRALTLLLEKVEARKLGEAKKPQPRPAIRPGTDNDVRTPPPASRHIPNDVKRLVRRRDDGRCAFVAADGRRCTERTFLEFHHQDPYAKQGPATGENVALRCRRHNQYEAELIFGPHRPSVAGRAQATAPQTGQAGA